GKVLGISRAVKSGIGSAAIRITGGATVGAIVAVNALGDVVSPLSGQILAGSRHPVTDEYVSAVSQLIHAEPASTVGTNTTIGVVATDAVLNRDELVRVAAAAHDGMARVVRPAHTLFDGDTFFALSTGQSQTKANPVAIAVAASEVVATAIVQAVMAARPLGGLPAARSAHPRVS
ncbi:MAG TPA: P1 family peptidase, partial [Chloroflexota bacterium]|nr:P1 family peptidase [Chloroflexota bacterium]